MKTDAIPHPNPDFNLEEIDDELLLYHPAKTRAVYLNETAALVWQLCDSKRSVADIISLLEENYPESDSIESDVAQTLKQLSENEAVELKNIQ